MSKKDVDTSVTKAPKTIQLKVVAPWFIVAVMTAGVVGLIGGWFIHADAMSQAGETVSHLKGL